MKSNTAPGVIELDTPLSPDQIVSVALGARLELTRAATARIKQARAIVEAFVQSGQLGYGINTGVGALCDVVIDAKDQSALSHNIVMSHACGVGPPLDPVVVRAIMACQINNFAHGQSGITWETLKILIDLLNTGITPVVPSRGSVGYLTHTAQIGLIVLGKGHANHQGKLISGREALDRIGHRPRVLKAKEGLSLINGTVCATGIGIIAHARCCALADWADAAASMSYSVLSRQADTFSGDTLMYRRSAGVRQTTRNLLTWLGPPQGLRNRLQSVQDPLSLRAVPQVHGAIRDELEQIHEILETELCGVSDNPTVGGTVEAPKAFSQANAVGAAVAFAADRIAIVAAQLGAISERRIDRLVNPLVSGLPAFLSAVPGTGSGFMIAQYTATSLVNENRVLATPATLGNGITSGLQEDVLTHATPAAEQALRVMDNLSQILAIELLCGAQAFDLADNAGERSDQMQLLYEFLRSKSPIYQDDRPLNEIITDVSASLLSHEPPLNLA